MPDIRAVRSPMVQPLRSNALTRAQSVDMQDQIELFLFTEAPPHVLLQKSIDLFHTVIRGRILLTDRREHRLIFTGDHHLILLPSQQKLHMAGKSRIVETLSVDGDGKALLDDCRHLVEHVRFIDAVFFAEILRAP